MAKGYNIQEGFRTGELTPKLDGQVSFDKYSQACRRLENFIPTAQGTAGKRPGFRFIAPAKYPDRKCRLVPFEFSTEQSYMLEFGHQYIRFCMNQGQIYSLDSYTKLLLSCNGDDRSTTFTDSSQSVHTVTANNSAYIDTGQRKFGTGSAKLGTRDSLIPEIPGYLTIPDSADFDFSGGIFTIDLWAQVAVASASLQTLFSQEIDANTQMTCHVDTSGRFYFKIYKDVGGFPSNVVSLTSALHVVLYKWNHIAVVENGDNWYLFINGVLEDTDSSIGRCNNYTSAFHIGCRIIAGALSHYFDGYIDEFRISKGIARWTVDFIPPANEYFSIGATPYQISTTYTESELSELQFCQSADIMFIVHPNHMPAKLSRTGHTSWTLTDVTFQKQYYPAVGMLTGDFGSYELGPEKAKNGTFSVDAQWTKGIGWTIADGKATKTAGNANTLSQNTTEVSGEIYKVGYTLTLTAGVGITVSIGGTAGTLRTASGVYIEYIAANTDGNLIFTPETNFAGLIDNVSVQKATPTDYGNCIDDNLGTVGYNNDIDGIGSTLEINAGTGKTLELIRINLNIQNSALNAIYDIEYYDTGTSAWVKAYTGWDLTAADLGWNTVQWTSVGAWQQWRLYKTNTAQAGGNVMEVEFIVKGVPKEWVASKYPSCCTFFEERLWFGYLETLWASKSGDFYNFTFGSDDDDALQYTIGSNQVNAVQWMSPGKILILGTAGNEYKVSASSLDEAITPLNIRIVPQSAYGSGKHAAISINEIVLYLSKTRRKIREFTYTFENDTYVSPDMTLLAGHLFTGDVKYMAYQQEPYSILWCVRNDGVLLGFTYQRLEGVTAWHRHSTDGYYENVACIPNTTGKGYDETWVVVQREINGSIVRYIEMLEADFDNEVMTDTDCFFVDSGLIYDGIPATVIHGLDHLEGEIVHILADGVLQTPQTVSASGTITLTVAASKVIAGLPYTSTLQTMRLNRNDQFGTAQGRKKRANQVVFRMYKTKRFKYGASPTGTLKEKIFDTLFSGDWEADFVLGWDREGYVSIVSDTITPCTVTAILPEWEAN